VLKVEMTALKPAIGQRTEKGDRPNWVTADRWKRVGSLYKRFGNAPLWLEEEGVRARATSLLDAIQAAPEHALDTASYPISGLKSIVDATRLTDTASAGTLADADVLLTAAYVAYAADMLTGQVNPSTISQAWHIPTVTRELDSAIVRGIEEPNMKGSLAAMVPQDPDYGVLKAAYARYRQIEAAGGWAPLAGDAPDSVLAARLAMEDITAGAPDADSISADSSTSSARTDSARSRRAAPTRAPSPELRPLLSLYQERHGLTRTGLLDKPTLAALNSPASHRVKQIAANLERHRWLPRSLGSRYVFVNVPAFRLTAYDDGQKVLEMKVVVGEEFEGKTTPVFADSMETVVFRPYWNVTPDIQAKEIGPKVAADPGYLARNDMEYFQDGGQTRIRQRPGEKNSLGLVKFLFPNSFNIYLHDTPAKELFAQADRAASHGCIRLEKPAEMAQWVLGWDAARVQNAMQSESDNQSVRAPQKIPVYIVYFTAYVRDGQLYFGEDIYDRDDSLEQQVPTATAGV
jgi:murein L,D-transpeptidase YcbB/YkuD